MKRKIPWFWRRQVSCPECGLVFSLETIVPCTTCNEKHDPVSFTCSRCNCHYTWDEFWDLNHDKYSLAAAI